MPTGPSDNEILSRVLQGDQQAYAEIVKRYQSFVFTIALRYTPNREDAEEIAQDSFVKAYRSLSDFRGESKFSTWLYTIVTTTSLTFLRKKKIDVQSLDNEKVFEVAEKVMARRGKALDQIEKDILNHVFEETKASRNF